MAASSCNLGVPEIIERRYDALEVGALGLLQLAVHILEAGTERVADDRGSLEDLERDSEPPIDWDELEARRFVNLAPQRKRRAIAG